jgi:iron complex outermembrane receptor protein
MKNAPFHFWNYCLLLIPFLLVSANSFSQEKLFGTVLSNQNKPLESASVTLYPSNQTVLTDKKGSFLWNEIPSGTNRLIVSFAGFALEERKLSDFSKSIIIILKPEVKELNEVLVIGNYAEKQKKEESLNVEVVNNTFIQRNLGGSLMQSLQRLPGVKTISIGSGGSKPLIRGLSFNQVIVVENGLKHEGQQWGADHGLEIDQYAVNRVEIIKGPSSFIYGSDAVGGAINIKPLQLPSNNTFGGSVDLVGKSNNAQFGSSFNLLGRNQNWFFDTRVTTMDYGDYRVPTDKVHVYSYSVPLYKNHLRNTAGRELDLHLSTGYSGQNLKSVFYFSNVHTKSGFFANAHGLEPRNVDLDLHDKSNRDILMPYQEVNHFKVSNTTSFQVRNHAFETQTGFQKNFRREWSHYVNHGYMPAIYPENMYAPQDLERQYDKDVWSFSAKDEFSINRHQITIGTNLAVQENAIGGWSFLIPAFSQFNAGLFAYDKIELNDKWFLHGAVRYDYGKIRMKSYFDWFKSPVSENNSTEMEYLQRSQALTKSFGSFTWSAGVNYNPGNLSLKANLGSGFRMPIAKELASNGVNYHYFRFEKGNPNLDAERSYQLDLGMEWQKQNWTFQLTPFVNYFPNFIYLNPTSAHDIYYGAGNQVFEYEQSKVFRYGAELQTRYYFIKSLSAEIAAEYLYSEQKSGSKKGYTLPFSPPPSVLFGLNYEPQIRFLKDAYFSVDYRFTSKQNNIVPPEKKTVESHVFNLAFGTKVKTGKQDISLSFQIQNLLNTKYLNHTSFYRLIELPEAGRNIIVSLRIPFSVSR